MNRNRKNVVRLSESKLRNMIKESVSQILTETGLDPRTLANAARIAKQRDDKRYGKFSQAAVDAWNDEYGIDDYSNDKSQYKGRKMEFIPNPSTEYNYQPDQYGVDDWQKHNMNRVGMGGQTASHYRPNGDGSGNTSYGSVDLPWGDRYNLDPKQLKKLHKEKPYRVAKEMSDGSGKYIPGKGWK